MECCWPKKASRLGVHSSDQGYICSSERLSAHAKATGWPLNLCRWQLQSSKVNWTVAAAAGKNGLEGLSVNFEVMKM